MLQGLSDYRVLGLVFFGIYGGRFDVFLAYTCCAVGLQGLKGLWATAGMSAFSLSSSAAGFLARKGLFSGLWA